MSKGFTKPKTGLKFKLGVLCIGATLASVVAMFLTSLDSAFFFSAFVFAFLAIVLLSFAEEFKGHKTTILGNNMSKWVRGDSIDPSNPFNIDKRYSK